MVDRDYVPFWLGLCGCAIGIFNRFGLGLSRDEFYWLYTIAGPFYSEIWLFSVIFPIVGMICGMTGKTKKAGIVMICCGVIESFLFLYSIGLLGGIFFIVGGYIIYRNAKANVE